MPNLRRSKLSTRLIGLGDSHLDYFEIFCAATCRVPGATAYGLSDKQSKTHAREAFISFLNVFPDHIPILSIGEVDCNSLPWFLNAKNPLDVIRQSIENLSLFLKSINRSFILPSVILPIVDSYKDTKIRLHVTSNLKERTGLVNYYNLSLQKLSNLFGHHYLDITSPTSKDGAIDKYFIRSTSDVHLLPDKVYPIALNLLDGIQL